MPKQLCKRCLYSSTHPFGLTFVDDVCSGCLTHSEKDKLDWCIREELLKTEIEKALCRRRSATYDCVIPVRGDAEDYFVLRNALNFGLRPLVVAINDYFLNDIGWYNLQNLITHFDVDSILYNPDIVSYKALVRTTLRKFDHLLWPALALHTSFPVHVAKERRIPIVLWGGLQATEQVGKFSHADEVQMSEWYRVEHDLFGQNVADTVGTGAEVPPEKLHYYNYPELNALFRSGIVGIYLSNYLRWDPLIQNHSTVAEGFYPQKQHATFDPYERAGNSVYYELHDLMKLKRVGYRKCRDHLVREIRHGRITREEALALDVEYSQTSVDIEPFFKWLDVSTSGYRWFIKHRLHHFEHLIGPPNLSRSDLPSAIAEHIGQGRHPQQYFLRFHKGIAL